MFIFNKFGILFEILRDSDNNNKLIELNVSYQIVNIYRII